MPIPLGILAAAGVRPAGAAGAYELIETVTVSGSSTTSVTFSNLNTYSSIYQHLQIRIVASHTGSGGNAMEMRFNGDTGNNYALHELGGNGSSVFSGNVTSSNFMRAIAMRQTLGNTAFSAGVVDILDAYETGKNKTVRGFSGLPSTDSLVYLSSGFRNNTEAISSITLFINSNAIGDKSRFSIYGLKASA